METWNGTRTHCSLRVEDVNRSRYWSRAISSPGILSCCSQRVEGVHDLWLLRRVVLRVRLNIAENWKLKLKTEKYYSKIIFKCVNSTMRPIFNEKITEEWNLWIYKQLHDVHWLTEKKVKKIKLYDYCSCIMHEQ